MPRIAQQSAPNRIAELRKAQRLTQTDLGDALGAHWTTISDIERGQQRLTQDWMVRIAKVLRVPPSELLAAVQNTVPVMGLIGAGALIEPEFEQVPPEGLYTVELPFAVPDEMLGLEVSGDSMLPRYDHGDVIVVYKEQRRPSDSFIGEEAAVRTADGRRYLKNILRGPTRDTFTLGSFNARPIEGVRLEWIGEIWVTVRAGQLRRIEAKERAAGKRRAATRARATAGMGELPLGEDAA